MKKANHKNTKPGDIVITLAALPVRYDHTMMNTRAPGTVCVVTSVPPKVRIVDGPLNDNNPYFVNLLTMDKNGSEIAANFCCIRLLATKEEIDLEIARAREVDCGSY